MWYKWMFKRQSDQSVPFCWKAGSWLYRCNSIPSFWSAHWSIPVSLYVGKDSTVLPIPVKMFNGWRHPFLVDQHHFDMTRWKIGCQMGHSGVNLTWIWIFRVETMNLPYLHKPRFPQGNGWHNGIFWGSQSLGATTVSEIISCIGNRKSACICGENGGYPAVLLTSWDFWGTRFFKKQMSY